MPVHFQSDRPVSDAAGAPEQTTLLTQSSDRFTLENRMAALAANSTAGQDVVAGLSHQPKTLPPKYFYDARGSELFEHITELPEYYLTRAEREILSTFAGAIADRVGACELIELGSGSASKTRLLFDAYQQRDRALRYIPVDVSGSILQSSAQALLQDYDNLTIHGLVSTYQQALENLPPQVLPRRLVAFIGSTLGNLTPALERRFLQQLSPALAAGDYLLLGVDRHKDAATLEAAYNDAQGITAQFNLNMLQHLNWRFDGNFDPSQFRHVALYNQGDRQIEMYLESLVNQTVTLKALGYTASFQQNERLLSEISRKFALNELTQRLSTFALNVTELFSDTRQQFALLLCQKQSAQPTG